MRRAAEYAAEAELKITDALGEQRGSLPVRVLSRLAKLGDQPELRLISAGAIAAGLVVREPRLRRAGVRMLAAHELATLAKNFAKHRIDRKRPRSAETAEDAEPEQGSDRDKENSSFPSGHSAGAVAVAQALAREFPEHRAAALTAAGLVAIGQIPKCAHYPTDVGAGAAIGWASEATLGLVWKRAER